MKTHEVKSWPEHFEAIKSGVKTFDLRRNDRDYHVADVLHIKEWNPDIVANKVAGLTGRGIIKKITYVMQGVSDKPAPLRGLYADYCILGLADLEPK